MDLLLLTEKPLVAKFKSPPGDILKPYRPYIVHQGNWYEPATAASNLEDRLCTRSIDNLTQHGIIVRQIPIPMVNSRC